MNKRGLGLIEILISVVILAIVFAGLANLFISGKRWFLINQTRMTGGELGKLFLDPMQMFVREDTWAANCLGQSNCGAAVQNINSRSYTVTYTITTPNAPDNNLRRVIATITWDVQPD